jgi:hypothetical protein
MNGLPEFRGTRPTMAFPSIELSRHYDSVTADQIQIGAVDDDL